MSYTIADLAHRWQLSEETIRKMIVRGDIPAFRIGKQWRVTEETVKWIETRQQQLPAK